MYFTMNDRKWLIKEVDGDWLLKEYQAEYDNGVFCFGLTKYDRQIIYINKDMCVDVKKQTLYHELMHCYIWNYITKDVSFSEEIICDISANSHDIIHKIVEDYFSINKLKL